MSERDQWLERRTFAWGGSEVAALLTAYGLAPHDAIAPGWITAQTEHYQRLGVPKLLAWKSGLRSEPQGDLVSMGRGAERERELLARFKASLAARRVDPRTIRHADTLPAQFYPFVDRRCAELAVTPDAWARAHDGELVMIELKCTYKPSEGRVSWHHRCQLQAEMAVCAARYGIVVVGEQWVDDTVPDGPVRAFGMPRDEELIERIRVTATEAWDAVERLRNVALELEQIGRNTTKSGALTAAAKRDQSAALAHAAEIWSASEDRLRPWRDATRQHFDAALEEIDGLDEILARQSA